MPNTARTILAGLLALGILACQAVGNPVLTPTAVPSATVTSTATLTATPTRTATPTATPLAIRPGVARKVSSGGFSYAPIKDFELQIDNYEALMQSPDERILIRLSGLAPFPGETLSDSVASYMEYLNKEYDDLIEGPRQETKVNNTKGMTVDFSSEGGAAPMKGRLTVLRPLRGKQLYILLLTREAGTWETYGEQVYQAVTQDISFFDLEPWSGCPVSGSEEYGYSVRHPIKLGGELLSGPQRERVYMSALLGPHNEAVAYVRTGSTDSSSGPIDAYKVFFGEQVRVLYVDIYSYEEPRTPSGMRCSGPLLGS